MNGFTCDGCGEGLLVDEDVRYVVRIEGYAAYDPMEITSEDLRRDLEAEMRDLIRQLEDLDADTAQDEVHRSFRIDLCLRCWRRYVKDPLAGLKEEGEAEQ